VLAWHLEANQIGEAFFAPPIHDGAHCRQVALIRGVVQRLLGALLGELAIPPLLREPA
jgi:hypothetical protein